MPAGVLPFGTAAGLERQCHRRSSNFCRPTSANQRKLTISVSRAVTETAGQTPLVKDIIEFLKGDLPNLFNDVGIDKSRYDAAVQFLDPITRYSSLDGYLLNIKFLKLVFDPDFLLHDIRQTGNLEITSRWTMTMRPTFIPKRFLKFWNPTLTFTGVSIYGLNADSGRICKHIDYWDCLRNQRYFSTEAFAYVMQQIFNFQRTPQLETPNYTVLRKTREYEVRRYEPYLVVQTAMEMNNVDGGKAGVNRNAFRLLANYLFGGNKEEKKMKMTTPVFTTSAGQMQFVVGKADCAAETAMPTPLVQDVVPRQESGGLFAVAPFNGIGDSARAAEVKQQLLQSMRADGLTPIDDEWCLARYNDPSTKPQYRRNEVLVPISAEDFDLWKYSFEDVYK